MYLLECPSGDHRRSFDGQFRRAGESPIAHRGRVTGLVLIASAPVADNATACSELRAAVDLLTDPVDGGFVRDFQYSTIAAAGAGRVHGGGDRETVAACRPRSGSRRSHGLIEYRPAAPRSYVRTLVHRRHPRRRCSRSTSRWPSRAQYPRARLRLIRRRRSHACTGSARAFVDELLRFVD